MKRNKTIIILMIVGLLGFSAGRFAGPKEIEIREVEKVVYKEREVKDESKDTRSSRREVIRPDGTREIEIIRETQRETHSDTSKDLQTETVKETKTTNQPNWSIGLYGNQNEYLGTIDRRILGGVFLGVYGRSDKALNDTNFGIGLRIEF